ncbi:pleckstrin-2-like [Anneissia japonica]|uniref:pleckstrin-2-like n=1 Tax=Anneissia japonica TaxID=1529436 RepID=UPI0014255F70|nr:pleckstrin-2-like [Anneissia japonica]
MTAKLKEGFLVKKGHVRTNWRTRWFVLSANELQYFKKKEDDVAAGIVSLRGCSVISPVPQYTKKTDVFQISSKSGQDLLIQASGDKEREEWVTAISDAIRAIDSVANGEQTGSESLKNNDLITAMQDPGGGITLETHVIDGKKYHHCFTGQDVVDWLLEWSFVSNRTDGVQQCNELLKQAHLQTLESGNRLQDLSTFYDDPNTLYRFSAFIMSDIKDLLSISSDESESDDENEMKKVKQKVELPAKLLNGPPGGKLIKQGFLMKRGHVRRTWKARLFLLWDKPQLLQYYRGSKINEEKPLGEVNINYCSVEIIHADSSDSKVKNKTRSNLFSVKTQKGRLYIFQASSPEERESWIRAIMCPGDFH